MGMKWAADKHDIGMRQAFAIAKDYSALNFSPRYIKNIYTTKPYNQRSFQFELLTLSYNQCAQKKLHCTVILFRLLIYRMFACVDPLIPMEANLKQLNFTCDALDRRFSNKTNDSRLQYFTIDEPDDKSVSRRYAQHRRTMTTDWVRPKVCTTSPTITTDWVKQTVSTTSTEDKDRLGTY